MIQQIRNKRVLFPICNWDPYRIINIVFTGIIVSILLYSALISPNRNNYPVISFHDWFTGESSISSGLSHGFSSIVRGELKRANEFNPYSIRLFSFFILQLIMRLSIFFYLFRFKDKNKVYIAVADAIASSVMFIIFFYPFIVGF